MDEVDQKTQDLCELFSAVLLQFLLVCGISADFGADDPEIYDGAHVSIQLVGRRLQEEKMLALAKYVGIALHGDAKAL